MYTVLQHDRGRHVQPETQRGNAKEPWLYLCYYTTVLVNLSSLKVFKNLNSIRELKLFLSFFSFSQFWIVYLLATVYQRTEENDLLKPDLTPFLPLCDSPQPHARIAIFFQPPQPCSSMVSFSVLCAVCFILKIDLMLYAVPLFDFLPGSIITMHYSRCEVEVVTLLEPQSQSRTAAGADWDPSTQDINTICSSVLQTVPTHTCTHTCLKIATCYLSETFLICECGIRSDSTLFP